MHFQFYASYITCYTIPLTFFTMPSCARVWTTRMINVTEKRFIRREISFSSVILRKINKLCLRSNEGDGYLKANLFCCFVSLCWRWWRFRVQKSFWVCGYGQRRDTGGEEGPFVNQIINSSDESLLSLT